MTNSYQTNFSESELLEQIPALRNFARRFYSSPNDIDDLVQDTLTKALANGEKFQRHTRLKSWLFTIMRNSFCTKFVLAKRERVGISEDSSSWSSVPAVQEWKLRGHELEQAILELPDHYRTAFHLIFIEGVSYEVAAVRCQCPIGTMKSRVNRARQQLSSALRGEPD
ncbi:sigma-70 family RNA polymerase sigma factor [Endobacterium cereale]|uniref:sigma-70 family RNA polymerase sigma factor n=1 Tax=Endobacterium cereale TaxID=2663029 RepID=UPI002B4730F7|nr:sigma-70 family RNA polymerase sigma factor [Endobacterium cereale]MEB2848387.1 sigma-70 family RNA polymerase sigma factor [Endobacterium cereale]